MLVLARKAGESIRIGDDVEHDGAARRPRPRADRHRGPARDRDSPRKSWTPCPPRWPRTLPTATVSSNQ